MLKRYISPLVAFEPLENDDILTGSGNTGLNAVITNHKQDPALVQDLTVNNEAKDDPTIWDDWDNDD